MVSINGTMLLYIVITHFDAVNIVPQSLVTLYAPTVSVMVPVYQITRQIYFWHEDVAYESDVYNEQHAYGKYAFPTTLWIRPGIINLTRPSHL